MAKRIFAAMIVASMVGLPVTATHAQVKAIAIDGCAKLARVIYTEVSASALYGVEKSGPWTISLGHGDLAICDHAAKTVSQAFTSAMLSAGYNVNWQQSSTRNGDFCWSGFLSQCYPNRGPFDFPYGGSDFNFVQKSWSVVSHAVMQEMYNPHSSDEVRFRDNDLKLRIGLALRSVSDRVAPVGPRAERKVD